MDFTKVLARITFTKLYQYQIRQQKTFTAENDNYNIKKEIKISKETIAKLERLSLVDFGNEAGIKRLEAAIKFAEKIKNFPIDDSVKPLYTVLEKESLRMRDDEVTEGNCHLGSGFLNLDRGFLFGPQGKLLRRNLEELWYRHCVVMPPYNVFLSPTDKLNETFDKLQSFDVVDKPLGIAVLENSKYICNPDIVSTYSKLNSHTVGKISIITDSSEGKDLYHRKQRERKVWWRKFSREPSRFKFSDVKKINKNKDTIDITAEFPFGSIVVETIIYQQDIRKINYPIKTNDATNIHLVEHITLLDWGCLAFLCDAYTPPTSSSSSSCELKLNFKLSPYKIGFFIQPSTEELDPKSQEKSRLLLYLNNQLKSKGIETIVTKTREAIESFQVPLIVTVDDTSLQNGIVQVWSQLTTLAESVHITNLCNYVLKRCNI
ncbi:hypothetical protein PV326_004038 [Microctonus aethiopoides]|nr:hypothetical protein PV326_004038 [Microctonus aethiopoides]